MKYLIMTIISSFVFAINLGNSAPNFSLINQNGQEISLADLKGKKVILEWYNHGCPFVRKHYDSINMQNTQKYAAEKGYIWLTINSSNIDKQGYIKNAAAAKARLKAEASNATHFLIDTDGSVGRLYNAKTTPEIFIINEQGKIEYMGAIDSISSADKSDIQKAQNYVKNTIEQIEKGQKISPARTRPYGCSVKY